MSKHLFSGNPVFKGIYPYKGCTQVQNNIDWWKIIYPIDAVFYRKVHTCTKFDPLNKFSKRRASYHFKA